MIPKKLNCTEKIIDWKCLLGKTVPEIALAIGKPFASYSYHDSEIYLYEYKPITSVVLKNGLVVKCNDLAESRRAMRVAPKGIKPVIIQGDKMVKGSLENISVAGAAVSHSDSSFLSVGDTTNISFALPIEGIVRFIEIPCRVQDIRTANEKYVTVFLFDLTNSAWKKRLVSRYVLLRKTQMELELDDSYLWGLAS